MALAELIRSDRKIYPVRSRAAALKQCIARIKTLYCSSTILEALYGTILRMVPFGAWVGCVILLWHSLGLTFHLIFSLKPKTFLSSCYSGIRHIDVKCISL